MEAIEIKITISKKAVDRLSELLEKIEDLDDLVPDWNRVEADQIKEDIHKIFYKILEPIEDH